MKNKFQTIFNFRWLCFLLVFILFIGGCGTTDNTQETTITIRKNGQVTHQMVDYLDEDYYDYNELLEMVQQEVESFEPGGVSLKDSHWSADGTNRVSVKLSFADCDVFSAFSRELLFYGTVAEALDRKIIGNVLLSHVEDGSALSETDLLQMGNHKILITDVQALIECPGNPTYYSPGIVVREDGIVDTRNSEGRMYAVY